MSSHVYNLYQRVQVHSMAREHRRAILSTHTYNNAPLDVCNYVNSDNN